VPTQSDPFGVFDLAALRRRTSMKWRTYPDDVLPCWIAEMDVALAEPVIRAVARVMAAGDTGYPDRYAYGEAFVEFAAKRWGWEVDPARTSLVPDVMRGVVELFDLVCARGDAVVINPPVYPPFFEFIAHSGREVITAPLSGAGRLDPETLDEAFRRATTNGRNAVFLLCSPHNPTGVVHTMPELAEVARLAEARGVRVIVDEIHAPIVAAGVEFVPYLTVPGAANAFCLFSASKAWNLAGLRAAVAVAGPDAAADLARLSMEVAGGASHVGVHAHVAALRDGTDWLDSVLTALDRNRRLLAELLAEHVPGVRYVPPQATFLAWLDCLDLGLGDDPAATFLHRGRVALMSGLPFGPGGAGHARLNFATSPDLITEAVRRMATALS
jgi:cysteine-S-conjugate beta-lyase